MSLAMVASEHRRLAILRQLEGQADYTSNVSILVDVCNGVGVPSTRDQVDGDCVWLAEQGLLIRTDRTGFVILRLTGRGGEVARGMAVVPGVKRPSAV